MASQTNRERIDRGLQLLARALRPIADRVLTPLLPAGVPWYEVLRERDLAQGKPAQDWDYEPNDVQTLIKVMTTRLGGLGYPFKEINRTQSNLLEESLLVRNNLFHGRQISGDDTLRALDTFARLLSSLGSPDEAKELDRERLNLQRKIYSEQIRTDTRAVFNDLADTELEPWHRVLQPHPDVLSGKFKESEFAANLYSVAHGDGDAGPEYRDPVEFFKRTYLTEGLKDLLEQAAGRISGAGDGAPVINLQTTFGGGKTHSMLAVWHLFGGTRADLLPEEIGRIASDNALDREKVSRAAIVGNELPPGQPLLKDDGTTVNTLWGEMAWQLGGRAGYDLVRQSDETATNPGSALRQLFAAYSPCVILVDEWVAYARQLYNRDDLPGGTFETQFTFAQALTEAASQTPGALVLVSIPASDARRDEDGGPINDLETGGENGRAALERLEHVVGRMAHQWRPASATESFEIVRRRLFEEPDDRAARKIGATAHKFVEYYRQNSADLPRHAKDNEYEDRMRRAFPIHPELFERLYEDWSTLERFQRTRGVLRLMSTVVKTLIDSGDKSPLIMPGSVPVGAAAVSSEFMQYVEPSWRAVIDVDVDGPNANSAAVDREKPLFGSRHLTVRLARTLFLGSAPTHQSAHKGLELKELYLGTAMPGDTINNFFSALSTLEDRSTYLFHDSARHWLDVSPSLNRTARDRAGNLEQADVDAALMDWVRRACADPTRLFQNIIVDPVDGADVPESQEVRLVVLGTGAVHRQRSENSTAVRAVRDITLNRGAGSRQHRNSLLFLAPDDSKLQQLQSVVRDHLAWSSIVDDPGLDLRKEQQATAQRRRDEEAKKIEAQVTTTWIWCLAPRQKNGASPDIAVSQLKADNGETRLAVRAVKRFTDADELRSESYAPALIRRALDRDLYSVWNRGSISVEQLWDYHADYLYLPRLRNMAVLLNGVESVLSYVGTPAEVFWLARGVDDDGEFLGLTGPLEDGHDDFCVEPPTLLVRHEVARAQKERERDRAWAAEQSVLDSEVDPGSGGGTVGDNGASPTGNGRQRETVGVSENRRVPNRRFTARHTFDPAGDLVGDIEAFAQEIVENLLTAGPDRLSVQITVSAEKNAGFDDTTIRNVTENSRTLEVQDSEFHDG